MGKRIKRIAALSIVILALLEPSAHATLPEPVQTALVRAGLNSADISMLITPVGSREDSRLPTAIQVIDIGTKSRPALPTNPELNTEQPLVIYEKQTIKQNEQQLQAYTDDPYTYQSLLQQPATRATSRTPITPSVSQKPVNQILKNRAPIVSHLPDVARTPASTMKLIPTFIALDTLGADFVWHTRAYHTGVVIKNRLQGDLIIQGSGDPKLTHERLNQLLYRVERAGITHIDGDIILDSAIFDNVSKDPSAFDNASLRPYNASPDGLLVNFSTVSIHSYPLPNGQAQLTYVPQLADYQLPMRSDTRAAVCSQAKYSLEPEWQADKLVLGADVPNSCAEHVFQVAYPDAKDFAARVIKAKWLDLGNTLSGRVIAQEAPYPAMQARANMPHLALGLRALPVTPLPIASYPSFDLAAQIYDINHFSNNVMTEQVTLSLSAYAGRQASNTHVSTNTSHVQDNKVAPASLYQFGRPKTTNYPNALTHINQWWQTTLTTPPPSLTNGSGLCRECTVTASNLSELLNYAYHQPSFNTYVDSLGVAGVSGTIASHSERLPQSAAIGRAWIKTGTLNNVTAMAGYVKGRSGQDYSVVGLINTEQALNAHNARVVLDTMLDWTAQH